MAIRQYMIGGAIMFLPESKNGPRPMDTRRAAPVSLWPDDPELEGIKDTERTSTPVWSYWQPIPR